MKRPVVIMVWTAIFVLSTAWASFQGFRSLATAPAPSLLALTLMWTPLLVYAVVVLAYWRLSRWAALLLLVAMIYQTVTFVGQGGQHWSWLLTAAISVAWPIAFVVSMAWIWRRLHWGLFRHPATEGAS